jgi:hypothetical protein
MGKRSKDGAADHLHQKDVKTEGPLSMFLTKITIFGFNCNSIPAITNLTYFMNQSMLLKTQKKVSQAEEIDFLISVLLITTKRAVQAGEVLRKIQAMHIHRINRNIKKLERILN